jgi:putative Mg2+ transporter-C (MgtC) family protein
MDGFALRDWSDIGDHLLRLSLAWLLALPIAWDREKSERSAGLRTFPLVAVAICGYIIAVERLLAENPEAHAQVLQGLATGIGFVGGGAIIKNGGSVSGTATAASIWVTGAIGAAVAYGQFDVAMVLSLVTFLTLRIMRPFKERGDLAPDAGDAEKD